MTNAEPSIASVDARVFDAIEYAARAHSGQYRKGTRVPYIIHPLRVAGLLIEYGAPADIAVAGVLHDTVEDTGATLAAIRERFGVTIAGLVEGVTEPDRSADWETRKSRMIATLGSAPPAVLWIACADKVDNVRSMQRGEAREGAAFWARFSRPRDKQAWYYRSVLAVVRERGDRDVAALAAELADRVEALFGPRAQGAAR